MVDDTSFVKGENIAATPGAVVFRNEMLELIQYKPTTKKVRSIPLLFVPPQINKYYFLDLAPGRSLLEYIVNQGFQPFVISWKNASPEDSEWDMDAYVAALYEAIGAMLAITKSDKFNSIGFCAGGITQTVLLAHMAAKGDERCNAFSNCVTLLNWDSPGILGMLQDKQLLKIARSKSEMDGVISGQELGSLFAWVRPNELIWNYWVNNYLMGKTPPSFDILAWNADVTNMPSKLHSQYLEVFSENSLARAGSLKILDENIDIGAITMDGYIIAGITDHLTPWDQCYRSAHLFGSENIEYILNEGGHIVTIVNPPDNPKSTFYKSGELVDDPEEWREHAEKHEGTWWEDYVEWLNARSGELKAAPRTLGNRKYKKLLAAPGEYIHS
jgi:polyhydroxyalkanoate synthase